jgi:hypothetical protein
VEDGSSDGCSAIASRQLGHRRFCRRSQLSNALSQRRQMVGPAYELGFGGGPRRREEFDSSRSSAANARQGCGGAVYRPLLLYRPTLLRTQTCASWQDTLFTSVEVIPGYTLGMMLGAFWFGDSLRYRNRLVPEGSACRTWCIEWLAICTKDARRRPVVVGTRRLPHGWPCFRSPQHLAPVGGLVVSMVCRRGSSTAVSQRPLGDAR